MNVTKTVTAPLNAVFAIVKFTAANPAGPATAWADNVVFEETNLAFTYDGNGNTTQDKVRGISNIVYNSLNLPTQLTNGSGTVSYGYLWSGARWFKKIPGSANVSYYIRGTGGELLGEYTNTPSTVNYLNRYGADLEGKWQKDTGTDYYYMKDHLGNIRQILRNSSGTPVITSKTDYYPFGAVLRETSSNTSAEAKFKYQNKERDIETGCDYFEARLYDSQTIRFLQVDPLAHKFLTMSPYVSMGNNPMYYTDPTGEEIQGSKEDLEEAKKLIDKAIQDNGIKNATVTVETRTETSVDLLGTLANMLMGSNEVAYQTETINYLATSGDGWAELANGTQTTGNEWADKGLIGLSDIIRSETVVNFQMTDQGPFPRTSLSEGMGGGSNLDGVSPRLSPLGNAKNPYDSKVGIFFHEVVGHGHPDSKNGDENKIGRAFGGLSTNPHGGSGGYQGRGFKRPAKLKLP